jgi:hypothetical protein
MTSDEKFNVFVKASEVFESRQTQQGVKRDGKKYKDNEAEFYSGVTAALDAIIGDPEKSSIIPSVFFSIMRGDNVYDELHRAETHKG